MMLGSPDLAARGLRLRPIERRDDAAVAHIIRSVMPEFGASGAGFAIHDAEVGAMCAAYTRPGAAYFVVETLGDAEPRVLGGAGKALLAACIAAARAEGYRQIYLETLTGMNAAQALYRQAGFEPIPQALGATGHFSCDRYYLLRLDGRGAGAP